MAAAAEALRLDNEYDTVVDNPLVIPVAELPEDELVRHRAERFIRALGAQAVEREVEGSERFAHPSESAYPTLMHEIHAAADGDPRARRALGMNVRAEMTEMTYKTGHVSRVDLEADEAGHILQHGQRLVDVYGNALELVSDGTMRERMHAETINGFRMAALRRNGLLRDYALVVFSRYPDNISSEHAAELGFFADTKSCSIQTLREWDGELVQETAFVAGVRKPDAERHDKAAIEGLAAELGVSFTGRDATATLAMPLLVHRSLMPNGVVDIVQCYDRHAGNVFFGSAKPPEDYGAYCAKCRERETQLEPRVQAIIDGLVAEAASISTPLSAFRRLHELAQRTMVDHALQDVSINPRVFGAEAAGYIERARYWLERGDYGQFLQSRDNAQETAYSSSCPAGIKSGELSVDAEDSTENGTGRAESGSSSATGERKKMTCPFCGDGKQYGDPCSPNQYCTKCHARVINGKVVSKGNGGRPVESAVKLEEAFTFRRQKGGRRAAHLALT